MKKILLFLLTAAACAVLFIPANASVPFITDSVTPPAAVFTETPGARDTVITVSYDAPADDCEMVRAAYLSRLLANHTAEEIAASASAWILSETKLFCEVTADGERWFPAAVYEPGSGKAELSLANELLPALQKGGAELSAFLPGTVIGLRLVTASEDYSFSVDNAVFAVSAPSETFYFTCPALAFIDAEVPADAVFPTPLHTFFIGGLSEDLALPFPTRRGYTFAGWKKDDGGYTENVPAGTDYIHLVSVWEPRTYALNYVLSTDIKFSFGRADNSKNPVSYTVGEETILRDIRSPVGGYTFDGWYLSRDFSGEKLTSVPKDSIGDLILYAKWISDEEKEARDSAANEAYARSLHYGDVDFDGDITAADARLVLRASVGLEELSAAAAKRADIFDSGILSAANARSILRISVGLDSLYTILTFYGIIMPERK